MANHQRRILRQYLAVTTALYAAGVGATLLPTHSAVTANITGGVIAVALGLLALAVLRWSAPTARTYFLCTSLAIIATPVVMVFHISPSAQVVCNIAAMFLAMYLEAFHPVRQARAMIAVLIVLVLAAVAVAPAPKLWFTYLVFAVSIGGAAVVYGSVTKALIASATTDPLTGLLNRAGLELAVARALALRRVQSGPVCLIVLDVDDFKTINDTEGHLVGDGLLRSIAQHWTAKLPPSAILSRIGGDEFAVVLIDCEPAKAHELAAAAAADSPAPISYGIASAASPQRGLTALYREADARLYAAKRARRPVPAEPER